MAARVMAMRRVGEVDEVDEVDEVAVVVVWLCSDDASFITGATSSARS